MSINHIPRPYGAHILATLVFLGAVACTNSPPSPTAVASKPTAVPAQSQATSTTSAAAKAPATPDWEQVVAEAKREGRVIVKGPQAAQTRDALTQGFMARYPEIELDFSGEASPQLPPKILTERAAGQYLVDVAVHGTSTFLLGLKNGNALDPIRPFLVGPDVRDASVWLNGEFLFADEAGRYNLIMSNYVKVPFSVNKDLGAADQFHTWRDLLDPRWKGKIAMLDPRQAGGGSAIATLWYALEDLGEPFMQQMATQEVTFFRDDRQLLDSVALGAHAIAIGAGDAQTLDLISRGLPLANVSPAALRETAYTTAGTGSVVVLNRAPHPNATRVYLNWLLSKDAQYGWSKAVGFASLRQDVPRDHVDKDLVPKPGTKYVDGSSERFVNLKGQVDGVIERIFKVP